VIFVQFYEVAECYREFYFLRRIERIETEPVLQAHDDKREAERVETRFEKLQVIGERREG